MANKLGMEKWVEVYQGDLGIALTDTFTSDVFFNVFDSKYAKLFDGVRQDSGDPIIFAEKTIKHYEKLRIDPMSKTIVFSDSLDTEAVEKIHDFCKGRIRDSYGIGTNLTNDVGVKPLNMVIKLTAIKINDRWIPTVKLSDHAGKHTGAIEAVNLCKQVLRVV
jgi:nicotinate phosphoribosyltransferase